MKTKTKTRKKFLFFIFVLVFAPIPALQSTQEPSGLGTKRVQIFSKDLFAPLGACLFAYFKYRIKSLGLVLHVSNLCWFLWLVMYWPLAIRSWCPFVTFTTLLWGDCYHITVTSAISKSYLVLKSTNKEYTIQSRVANSWLADWHITVASEQNKAC